MDATDVDPATLTLCVLLWARDGQELALTTYEDSVLGLLGDHGGTVLQRARRTDDSDGPLEVQMLQFDSPASLESFLDDPRRQELHAQRDAAVDRTQIIEVALVG
jgi:uncharacterized protein (DUF1330 family)